MTLTDAELARIERGNTRCDLGHHVSVTRLLAEVRRLRAEVAAKQRGYDDLHAAIPDGFGMDIFTKVDRVMKALAASQAEVARLAALATEACDVADRQDCTPAWQASQAKRLRTSIPTPDPAAIVAAVERYGKARVEWARLDHDADEDVAVKLHAEVVASRAALHALLGLGAP